MMAPIISNAGCLARIQWNQQKLTAYGGQLIRTNSSYSPKETHSSCIKSQSKLKGATVSPAVSKHCPRCLNGTCPNKSTMSDKLSSVYQYFSKDLCNSSVKDYFLHNLCAISLPQKANVHMHHSSWKSLYTSSSILSTVPVVCSNHAKYFSTQPFSIERSTPSCHSHILPVQRNFLQSRIYSYLNGNYQTRRTFTKTVEIRDEDVIKSSDIQKFLAEKGMKFEQGHTCFVSACPMSTKKKAGISIEKMYINMTTGHFICNSCGKHGGWMELKDHISLLATLKKKKDYECFKDVETVTRLVADISRVTDAWADMRPVKSLTEEELNQLFEDMDYNQLSKTTLEKFNVTYNPNTRSVVYPYLDPEGTVMGNKRVTCKLGDGETIKSLRETAVPRSGILGLFGWSTVTDSTTEVVLTSSEVNAMAVYQETKVPALSLPKGYTLLAQEVLPSLERFSKILLWFGDDIRAWEAAKQFANKLNTKRCYVIRPTAADPSPFTALKQGLKLRHILGKAKPISHKSIVSFSQLRQEVFSELAHVEQVAGVKWRRYPALNRLLKGHRRGELTVFTGPTGSGKTTFMSDYSLDLCMQGVNTLWGSFEINNVRLGKMMLTQFAMKNLTKHLDEFDHWANSFEELPIFFMTFHGQESIRKVIDTMSHAVYVHDIAHVVVDNLQFMMGTDGEWSNRFSRQDQIISSFRRFATAMNCHVSLVIHPRKEKDTEELTTASIFGSAKASQESDNVILLQDKRLSSLRGRKYIQITKNRFDGELGIMLLKFDKESLTFSTKEKEKKKGEGKKTEDEQEKQEVDQDDCEGKI